MVSSLNQSVKKLSQALVAHLRCDVVRDGFACSFLARVIPESLEYFTQGQHSAQLIQLGASLVNLPYEGDGLSQLLEAPFGVQSLH